MAGRLRELDQSKVIQILESNGFKKVRSGKHITFKKADADGTILTTWVPHHDKVTAFVIRYIIKQTKKPKEEFY